MSHTPGPWRVENTSFEPSPVIVGLTEEGPRPGDILPNNPRCRVIAQCKGTDDEGLANARLIAAAPILLEACQEAENTFLEYGERAGFPEGAPECWAAIEALRAAIAKAEGKDGAK